jgi:hypothetical protein
VRLRLFGYYELGLLRGAIKRRIAALLPARLSRTKLSAQDSSALGVPGAQNTDNDEPAAQEAGATRKLIRPHRRRKAA